MAFPTNTDVLSDLAAQRLFGHAKYMRQLVSSYVAQCVAGSLDVHDVALSFMGSLSIIRGNIAVLQSVSGVFDALVRAKPDKFPNASSAQTDVASIVTSLDSMLSYMETNLPVDAQRRLLSLDLSNNGTGTLTHRTITNAGSLASFRTQLELFRDTFEA